MNNEPTIDRETIFRGKVFDVYRDTIMQHTGDTALREIVSHTGGVGIVAVVDGEIFLVKQYRKAAEQFLLEIPAGKLSLGEQPIHCAYRELKEEVGITAEKMEHVGSFYVSPGYNTELIHIYKAEDMQLGESQLDEGEFLDVVRMPFAQAVEMCRSGEISDGKTVIAIMMTEKFYM